VLVHLHAGIRCSRVHVRVRTCVHAYVCRACMRLVCACVCACVVHLRACWGLCMNTCACMYLCACVCLHMVVCMCGCVLRPIHARVNVCASMHVHVYTCACIFICLHVHTGIKGAVIYFSYGVYTCISPSTYAQLELNTAVQIQIRVWRKC